MNKEAQEEDLAHSPSLQNLAEEVDLVKPDQTRSFLRLEVYLFASLDMVGSTALKNEKFKKFGWIDVVTHFYESCQRLVADLGFEGQFWKYIGDEILLYQKITKPEQIEKSIRALFRSMERYEKDLENSHFSGASNLVSIKGVAWLAPVRRYVSVSSDPLLDQKHVDLDTRLSEENRKIEDQVFGVLPDEEGMGGARKSYDFLGPNIDSGFRIAKFSRRRQLVLSAALAYYLLKKNHGANNLRVVEFDELKGIAKGKLYPGIWYNEDWASIHQCFPYDEKYRDSLIRCVCEGRYPPVPIAELIEEIRNEFVSDGYFFEKDLLEEIMELSESP